MERRDSFEIVVDGRKMTAYRGQTLAEALLENGVRVFRTTRNQAPRGLYCGIGLCYECRMIVNGVPNTRVCITAAAPGCKVNTQDDSVIELDL